MQLCSYTANLDTGGLLDFRHLDGGHYFQASVVRGWASGGVGWDGRWKNVYTLLIVATSARSNNYKSTRHNRYLTGIGVNFRSIHPIWCPPWANCLSHDFTASAKFALESQPISYG